MGGHPRDGVILPATAEDRPRPPSRGPPPGPTPGHHHLDRTHLPSPPQARPSRPTHPDRIRNPPPDRTPGLNPEPTGSTEPGAVLVTEMQAKLHRWAAADTGRRFDDLFNFVHDPATLLMAFVRVAGNQGANTPGVDGWTVAMVEEHVGVPGFLDGLRTSFKEGTFRPLPVRERSIPKPGGSGKVRKLGIPT